MTLHGVNATESPPPIRCSLTAAGGEEREREWRRLFARALIARTRIPGGVRIELHALPGVRDDVARLIAAEHECCPFMTLSIGTNEEAVLVLTATGPEDAAAFLEPWFGARPPVGESERWPM